MRTPRSNSRLSMSSKQGGGSRASDEDGKTAVKVGMFSVRFVIAALVARKFVAIAEKRLPYGSRSVQH